MRKIRIFLQIAHGHASAFIETYARARAYVCMCMHCFLRTKKNTKMFEYTCVQTKAQMHVRHEQARKILQDFSMCMCTLHKREHTADVYVYVHVRSCTCLLTCLVSVGLYTYIYIYIYTYSHHILIYIYIYIGAYLRDSMHVCVCVVYACVYACMQVCARERATRI